MDGSSTRSVIAFVTFIVQSEVELEKRIRCGVLKMNATHSVRSSTRPARIRHGFIVQSES